MLAVLLDSKLLIGLEAVLVACAVFAALRWPVDRPVPLGRLAQSLARLSDRPYAQVALVIGLAIAARAALLPVLGPPLPIVPDEFSLLLQGETLARGALANPAHPLAPFFETHYVIQQPSYASMYFIGRGLPLGLGEVLFGEPWAGVWATMVVLSGATVWMLRGWVSANLALLGGILVVARFGVVNGWMNAYYGGGLIALGGVLVLGAWPRLSRTPRGRDGLAFGLGLAILMISRPFEGLLFSLPFLLVAAWRMIGHLRLRHMASVARLALPVAALTGAGAVLLLASNAATTGELLVDGYSHHRASYSSTPAFLFAPPHRPTRFAPDQLRAYYDWEGSEYRFNLRSPLNLARSVLRKARRVFFFYVGPVLLIPLLVGLPYLRRFPVVMFGTAALAVGFMAISWSWSQYFAPGFGAIMLLIMLGFGRLATWRFRQRPSGLVLCRLLPSIVILMTMLPVAALFSGAPRPRSETFERPCCAFSASTPRSELIDHIEAAPGRHLVIARNLDKRPSWEPYVANGADIDGQRIVWAHDLGARNQALLAYFPDRHVWLLDGADVTKIVRLTRPPFR